MALSVGPGPYVMKRPKLIDKVSIGILEWEEFSLWGRPSRVP
jgi:hypothetical protein